MSEADLIAIEVEWAAISVESASKLAASREELAVFWEDEKLKENECNTHPNAPHGFLRNASHNAGRYVCECEHWEKNA